MKMLGFGFGLGKLDSIFGNVVCKPEKIEEVDAGDSIQVGRHIYEVVTHCVLVDRNSAFRVFDKLEGGKCVLAFLKGMPHEEGEYDSQFSHDGFLKLVGASSNEKFGKIEKR